MTTGLLLAIHMTIMCQSKTEISSPIIICYVTENDDFGAVSCQSREGFVTNKRWNLTHERSGSSVGRVKKWVRDNDCDIQRMEHDERTWEKR